MASLDHLHDRFESFRRQLFEGPKFPGFDRCIIHGLRVPLPLRFDETFETSSMLVPDF